MTGQSHTPRETGCVHVYTGDGKGKTTAALGLAVRAAGAGLDVLFVQFLKGMPTGETESLAALGRRVEVRRYGRGRFVRGEPSAEDRAAARQGLDACRQAVRSGRYSLVVLDEANVAACLGLIDVEELIELIDTRAPQVELVFTGRGADERLCERADLVTEMRPVKHYFDAGKQARRGIEC